MPGKGKLTLTGQLGDVMKESVTAALSFVRSRGRASSASRPATSSRTSTSTSTSRPAPSPRTGPSAGVTMYTALVSLLTGVPVRPDVAMTGEITLRGNVLQIGGVKEKLLAAHRAGIKRVIIPERNVKDLIDVPDEVKQEMEILRSSGWTRSWRCALTGPARRDHRAGEAGRPRPPATPSRHRPSCAGQPQPSAGAAAMLLDRRRADGHSRAARAVRSCAPRRALRPGVRGLLFRAVPGAWES